jgi:hypothetical protein
MLGEPVSHHGEGGRAVCETAGVRLCCQGDGYLVSMAKWKSPLVAR